MAELHDVWRVSRVQKGDVIHLIATFREQEGQWHTRIDRNDGFLILFPDILISGEIPLEGSFA